VIELVRQTATQLLNFIQERQHLIEDAGDLASRPANASILLTLLSDIGDPLRRQGTHAVLALLAPGQNHIAMELAAGATAVRGATTAGDLIDTALHRGGVGEGDLDSPV
jgi:hypothetical protein